MRKDSTKQCWFNISLAPYNILICGKGYFPIILFEGVKPVLLWLGSLSSHYLVEEFDRYYFD